MPARPPIGDDVHDRSAECADPAVVRAAADAAWAEQRTRLIDHSPFYRRKLQAAGTALTVGITLDDLASLPLTTKDDLRIAADEHPPFGDHLAAVPSEIKRVFQTSGTSGTPSLIALTGADLNAWTEIGSRTFVAAGIRPHHSVLTTFGAGPFTVGHVHTTIDRLGAGNVPVGPGDITRAVSALRRGLADTVVTTPSFALHLAGEFEPDEARELGLLRVITGGEPGGGVPSIRQHIEDTFGAGVVEVMGIGDIAPSLFGECPVQAGMHFNGNGFVWPELIDDAGAVLPFEPGRAGELVYTHLRREAMPLLRFRSGDVAAIVSTSCPCGRTGFTVRVHGRRDDMFIVHGVNIYPAAVQAVVAGFAPLVTGRIHVVLPTAEGPITPPVPVEVEILSGAEPPESLSADIEAALHRSLSARFEARMVNPDVFGDASYKTRATSAGTG